MEKDKYENISWNMPKHSLENKITIMGACGKGTGWRNVEGKFIVKIFILLNLEPCEYIIISKT